MKSIIVGASVLVGLMVTGVALATDMPDAAKKNGCIACHTIDKKLVGPAWIDVSKKYKGDKTAETKLIEKVSKGGSGVWGPVPMPANTPKVSQPSIKELVDFILALAK